MTDAVPRLVVFPRADAAGAAVSQPVPAVLAGQLVAALEWHCGVAVTATPLADEAGPCDWWANGAGGAVGIGGGGAIASAMLARRCGGSFEATAPSVSPQVENCRAALHRDIRDTLLASDGDWVVTAPRPGVTTGFAVVAGGVADRIDLAVIPAVPAVDRPAWQARLGALVGALPVPVRLVLHDGHIAVRAARALGVGDVLPIAAAHEVGLRVGGFAWARGNVEDEGGAPRIRIVARAARPLLQEPA